ncbi:hypothetical protein EHM92_03410, partial [bacterium]
MNTLRLQMHEVLSIVILVTLATTSAVAQDVVTYPGAGVFRAGKLWDSFLPQNVAPYYYEKT